MHNVYGGTWAAEQEAKCLGKHSFRKRSHLPVTSGLWLQCVEAVHKAGHALLQCVQCVVLRVVASEAVPQTAQSIPYQL